MKSEKLSGHCTFRVPGAGSSHNLAPCRRRLAGDASQETPRRSRFAGDALQEIPDEALQIYFFTRYLRDSCSCIDLNLKKTI